MSGVPHSRKPDRQFYQHPRYDNVNAFSNKKYSNFDNQTDEPRSHNESYATNRMRNATSQRGRAVRGFTRSNLPRSHQRSDNLNLHKTDSAIKAEVCSQQTQETAGATTAYSQSDSRKTTINTLNPDNSTTNTVQSTGRHGGLILLPKDVDIHETPTESNVYKPGKREFHATGNKPVVVVRPSFSRISRNSESETDTKSYTKTSLQSEIHCSSLMKQSLSGSPLLDETTEGTFKFFLQSFYHNDQPEAKTPALPGTPSLPNPATARPPSQAVLATVQQIVQLDSTLSSLLVPPGLCASVLSQIRINADEESGLTEPERLLVRWWHSVQQLREHLFNLFESVILADLDFCNAAHVEQGMWKSVFYTELELLRSWISSPETMGLTSVDTKVAIHSSDDINKRLKCLLQKICLRDVIAAGESRLQNLLDRIQVLHQVNLTNLLADGRPPPETRSRTRRLVYLSSQKLMLFIGDLARYKELLSGDRNFGKARSWYQKARLLIPKNGRSYNQLAVLAVYTSRHLDAMYYYIRTLAASNPFLTASQSLAALFNEFSPRAERLLQQMQKPKSYAAHPHEHHFGTSGGRFQRVEIWIHPLDGQTTVIQGTRRLVYASNQLCSNFRKTQAKSTGAKSDVVTHSTEDEDEEAQAELEEYANMSLIELSRQFTLTFIHTHGKLFTKIGMETFPEFASLALQALSGLLAQSPCPLSAERLCQLCIVNMYNVDRAVSLTSHTTHPITSKLPTDSVAADVKVQPIGQLTGVETLRSVHHDHAARFALDMFSLLCRRAAQLFQQAPPPDTPSWWLPDDARVILPALRLWSEWMILHPEHWLPPPNHRDPTLGPYLNDWKLVADFCTRASRWLARNTTRPQYEEITPTSSMLLRLKENTVTDPNSSFSEHVPVYEAAFLFEESMCTGFKPMLDLVPKMYHYTGKWSVEEVSDFVRIDKLVLFGDFLCGIDSPVLQYDVDRSVYESIVERECSERQQDRSSEEVRAEPQGNGRSSSGSEDFTQQQTETTTPPMDLLDAAPESEILALQHQRAALQRQLEEEQKLLEWRQNAIRQAASGGRRAVELEVRPIYLLPDTNCYIDWLEGIATLTQRSSNYMVLVPIVVVNELDSLAHPSSKSSRSGLFCVDEGAEVTRSGLIQERARAAIAYLENEFAHRNSRLRALTAKGKFLETIAYRTEVNGGRDPGQVNDDVILNCCTHFCKDDPERFRSSIGFDGSSDSAIQTQPIRIVREIVLLTSDRNLRLKALNINIPARPLRTFVNWSRLPLVDNLPVYSTDPMLAKNNDFPKLKPRGQWREPLRH